MTVRARRRHRTLRAVARAAVGAFLIGGLVGGLVGGLALTATPGAAQTLVAERCDATLAKVANVRCGRLSVPLDHDTPAGRKISIFVTALLAEKEAAGAVPVVYLSGGPGQAGSTEADYLATLFAEVRRERTVLLVDQRGTGRAEPSLLCPKVDPTAILTGNVTAAAVAECRRSLGAEIKLDAFTSEAAARDIVMLRKAFGIERWDVIGTSYGGVLALALLRGDPTGVRSVLLNSPSLQAGAWREPARLRAIADAFRRLFADCATVPACAARAPDLRDAFDRISDRMRQQSPAGWNDALTALVLRLGTGVAAAALPDLIVRLDRAPPADAAAMVKAILPPEVGIDGRRFALMLNLATSCLEDKPASRATLTGLAASLYPYIGPETLDPNLDTACPVLGLRPIAPLPLDKTIPQRPVLMLSGLYDTFAPATNAQQIAAVLPKARFATFRGFGHDLLAASACARTMMARFLAAPDQPDLPDCAELYLPPPFPEAAAAPPPATGLRGSSRSPAPGKQ